MRSLPLLLSITLVLLFATSVGAEKNGLSTEVPSLIFSSMSRSTVNYPVWVDFQVAVNVAGDLDESLFHPHNVQTLRSHLEQPRDPSEDCLELGPVYESWVNPPDWSSLTSLIRDSSTVMIGRVIHSRVGFDHGMPSTLYQVTDLEVLKGSKPPLDAYVFSIPIADVKIEGRRVCKSDSRFAASPMIGGRVLLALQQDPGDDIYIHLRFPFSMISISPRGEVSLSSEIKDPRLAEIGTVEASSQAVLLLKLVRSIASSDEQK